MSTTSLPNKLNVNAPRYTSYPPAPFWDPISSLLYLEKLQEIPKTTPLSLYFHIPFCASMCLFCGCSVILNRNPQKEEEYVTLLCKEIDLVAGILGSKRKVSQLHFGGGTPTKLSIPLLEVLFAKITSSFEIDFKGEVAIEIDPRTVMGDQGEKLRFLQALGFNRVSFGVQDTNQKVQEAIKRRQSKEMTLQTYALAKQLGFKEINLDLIYGLPFQTEETFQETVEAILSMRPDRIALFSYAKIPWLKAHQKAIPDETLPSTDAKFAIYEAARRSFMDQGYIAIGMDHFALKSSDLAKSYYEKTLHRNFQGYTVLPAQALIGFGVTAIGSMQSAYIQNVKEIPDYRKALEEGRLPVFRGKVLSQEDLLRRWVIQTLMCTFQIDKELFRAQFHEDFDLHFQDVEMEDLEDLVVNSKEKLLVTPKGELFIRNIAMRFDAYLPQSKTQFSQTV